MSIPNPFQFLNLPGEARRMVYNRLPRQIKHHHVIDSSISEDCLVLVTRYLPVAILATCKMIHDEAIGIIDKMQNEFILSERPRFIANRRLLFRESFTTLFDDFTLRCFTQAQLTSLVDRVRSSLREISRDCLQPTGVDTMIEMFNAQTSRQLAYNQKALGRSESAPIRFMLVDEVWSAMSWNDKMENSAEVCIWLNDFCNPKTILKYHCDGFLSEHWYTSSGFAQEAIPTLVDVRERALSSVCVRKPPFDNGTWRREWMK